MRPTRLFLLAMAFTLVASFAAQAGFFQITKPLEGETLSPLQPMQRALAMMTEEQLGAFLTQEMANRMAKLTTYPAGVQLEWRVVKQAASYEVRVSENAEMLSPRKQSSTSSKATVFNLEIGRKYYVQVVALDSEGAVLKETSVRSFQVDGLPPRVLCVPKIPNFRDLGGYVGLEGRVVSQGKIFRSAAFNANSPDGGKTVGETRVTEKNRAILLSELKLKTEIDLRWDSELADMSESPLGTEVQYLRIPSTLYGGLFTEAGYKNYRQLFPIFTKAENYPIDFHCILGADRTGSLALVLLATLGVSREDIVRDYCLTSLYSGYLRPPHNLTAMFDGLAKCGKPGDNLSDQAMRFLLRCGLKSQEIYDFLTIMLGEGLVFPQVLVEARLGEEIQSRFQQPPKGLAVAPYVVRRETMLQDGREVSWTAPTWHSSPVCAAGSDGSGANYFKLLNSMPVATMAKLVPDTSVLTAPEYVVFSPDRQVAFAAPDGGVRWSVASLAEFGIALRPQEEFLLVVQPASATLSAGLEVVPFAIPEFTPNVAVAPAAPAPMIDGQLDEATWQGAKPVPMSDIHGAPQAQAPLVWLRTDDAHSTLFIAVKLQDLSVDATHHVTRDAALWNEDSIEIFLSCQGEIKTYQLIFNAADSVWDGLVDGGQDWTIDQCEFKSAQTPDGWTIEVAIPLAQFDFSGALELNVCANDNPGAIHYNLFPTQGAFHERSAISPVLLQ